MWIFFWGAVIICAIAIPIARTHPTHYLPPQYTARTAPSENDMTWIPVGAGNVFTPEQVLSEFDGANWTLPQIYKCRTPESGSDGVYQYFKVKAGQDCTSGRFLFKSGPTKLHPNEQCPRANWYDPALDSWVSAPTDPSCLETTDAYCNGVNSPPVEASECLSQGDISATLDRWRSEWHFLAGYPTCKDAFTNCPTAVVTNPQGAASALGAPPFSSNNHNMFC
jgi:hypothetical protein